MPNWWENLGGAQSQMNRPADWFLNPPPFDPDAFANTDLRSKLPGSDINSAIDIGQRGMRFAESIYNQRLPFQNYMYNFLRSLGSGTNEWMEPMLAPISNVISSQLPQAQRQVRDTTSGGNLMEGLTRLSERSVGELSQAASGIQQQGLGMLSNVGLGLPEQMYPWFAAMGQILKKSASGGGSPL